MTPPSGEEALLVTLRHLCLPHYEVARCLSASSWIARDHRDLRARVAPLAQRASRAASFRLCRACLRGGRFCNHYGLCRRCRPLHKPEVRRRFLIRVLGLPQPLVRRLGRRPGTQQYPVALDDVWELFRATEAEGALLGRAWRERMRRYPHRGAFIEACRGAVIAC